MYYEERKELNELLIKLCSAQDDVTHMNEAGPERRDETMRLIVIRDGIRHEIVRFVDGLMDPDR